MISSSLTKEQFIVWRKSMGMSHAAAAKRLGLSVSALYMYEAGRRVIPYLVTLGMSAISNNIQPYGGNENDNDSSGTQSQESTGV
jgi:transcriptional regulator with XRE-family HTH domain